MSTVIPEGKNVQNAIKWISANLEENENQSICFSYALTEEK